MSGYNYNSEKGLIVSNNALAAMDEGKYPKTYFKAWQRRAIEAGAVKPCEWHHTGSKYRCTQYYNSADFAELDPKDFPVGKQPAKAAKREVIRRFESEAAAKDFESKLPGSLRVCRHQAVRLTKAGKQFTCERWEYTGARTVSWILTVELPTLTSLQESTESWKRWQADKKQSLTAKAKSALRCGNLDRSMSGHYYRLGEKPASAERRIGLQRFNQDTKTLETWNGETWTTAEKRNHARLIEFVDSFCDKYNIRCITGAADLCKSENWNKNFITNTLRFQASRNE
ncbi:MAG: hypothetical protein LBT46_15525 [Planctomycetaceae bacterium]|jgi:hypothetical protein|nr:hypothetical protein [Planctomycetaceae bacterium]